MKGVYLFKAIARVFPWKMQNNPTFPNTGYNKWHLSGLAGPSKVHLLWPIFREVGWFCIFKETTLSTALINQLVSVFIPKVPVNKNRHLFISYEKLKITLFVHFFKMCLFVYFVYLFYFIVCLYNFLLFVCLLGMV